MHITTLNIRHGGGERIRQLVEQIEYLSPNILVLTEFRNGATGDALRSALGEAGWEHQAAASAPGGKNSVLVASREKIAATDQSQGAGWDVDRHLVVRVGDLWVVAVYLPPGPTKIPAWERLLATARRMKGDHAVLVGDFNTGKHYVDEEAATFIAPESLDRLEALGYVDAWRSKNPGGREYTWFSGAGNGFRLDYAFISHALSQSAFSVRHVDEPRIGGSTDHSALDLQIQT